MNPVHDLPSYFIKIDIKIILLSMPRSSKWTFLQAISFLLFMTVQKSEGWEHLEHIGMNEKIILKWILEEESVCKMD